MGSQTNTEQDPVSVRGYTALNAPVSLAVRAGTLLIDAAWILAVYAILLRVFDLSPVPGPGPLTAIALLTTLLWCAQQLLLGGTIGQLVWRVRLIDGRHPFRLGVALIRGPGGALRAWFLSRARQHERLGVSGVTTAVFLTFVTTGCAFWVSREALWRHPLLMRADDWKLEAFVPDPQSGSSETVTWGMTPLSLYSLGVWPSSFAGKPVLYTLPYEKGPPHQFVGHIVARWEMPNTKLTAEGPRTPEQSPTPARLRECVTAAWNQAALNADTGCLRIRERALMRHVRELRAEIAPREWRLRWFEVRNENLGESERPRGIYLAGWNGVRAQERFILVGPKGAHQTFVLDRPVEGHGQLASELFQQAIRSQRLSDELRPGRAWADRALADTRLDELDKLVQNPAERVARLAAVQSLLLSKISVDPRTYDSYYHLGGTALLLAKHAIEQHNSDWSAVARPLAQSALRYARDVAPGDARTEQLEKIWKTLQ